MARYSGIVRVRQDNRSLAEARNAGFRASTGDYVLFLDVDDRLTPNAVEAHLSCFAKHPQAGFVVGDIDQITLDGSYVVSPRSPVLEANHYEELLKVNHVANTIAVMFRRSVIELTGGFKLSCSPAEDYELLLPAARLFLDKPARPVVRRSGRATGRKRHDSSSKSCFQLCRSGQLRQSWQFAPPSNLLRHESGYLGSTGNRATLRTGKART